MKLSVIGFAVACLMVAGSAFAEVDIEAAKTATASCNGCHSGAMAVKLADATNKDPEAIRGTIVDGLDTEEKPGVMPKQDLGDQLDNVVEWIAAGAPEE